MLIIKFFVAIFVFGIVIFIHELGHFFVAKKCGVRVNEFAIGMGPTIFKFSKGETKYALRLLPIGGFVSMEGEDEESNDERGFTKSPVHKRMLIIVAGAFMNIVLGFLSLVLLISTGGDIVSKNIALVEFSGSGLQVGDEITRINGRLCFTMNDLSYEFARTQNGNFDFEIKRNGNRIELNDIEFPVVQAADKNGEVVINENTGEPYEVLDIGFKVYPIKRSVGTVIKESFNTTVSYGRIIYQSLIDLVSGRTDINQLSGPVGIVKEIGGMVKGDWQHMFKEGWRPIVNMLALISINLGIVNMLPLPALDGGKMLLLIVEAVRKKPINQKYEIAINLAGFALLMLLMVFISFNDVRKLFM